MKKTIVYIDGFNLYYCLRKTPYRWFNLEKLSQIYLNPNQHDIIKIKYFTARVKREAEDDSNIIRQSMYLRAIKTIPKLDIIYGQFKKRQVAGLLCDFEDRKQLNKNIVKITKWEEKMSNF